MMINRFRTTNLTAKAAIHGMLNLVTSDKFSSPDEKKIIENVINNTVINHKRILENLDDVIERLVEVMDLNYIKSLIMKSNITVVRGKLIRLVFEKKLINSMPDMIEFLSSSKGVRHICFVLAIEHASNLIEKFEENIEISYYDIMLAIDSNVDNKTIENFIKKGVPKSDDDDKDEYDPDEISLLTAAINMDNAYIRDVLIKKLESLSIEIDWYRIFKSFTYFDDTIETKRVLSIDMFNYLFGKIKLSIKKGKSISIDDIYSGLWNLRAKFLTYPLDISKPFIDQYVLEKFQNHNEELIIEGDEDVEILDDLYGYYRLLKCNKFNKESVLYYLLKFPDTSIYHYYLTQEDVIYLVNNGFDYNRIADTKLQSGTIRDFMKVYQNAKTASLDDIATYVPSVINELISNYI